jgi:hypothetical protein
MLNKLRSALELAGMILGLTFCIGGIAILGLLLIMLIVNMFR